MNSISRETAIALAKEAGMAGMLTDVVCSLEEIHRLCNLAVAHSRKDAEPVAWQGRVFYVDGDDGWGDWHDIAKQDLPVWKRRISEGDKRELRPLFTHPPEADKLLQQALEYAKLMQLYGPALGYGNTTIDDHIAALRTYLEGK